MGYGNQPVFTALEDGKDEHSLTNKPSGADGGGVWTHGAHNFEENIMSLPFNSLGYDHFPGRDMQEYAVPPADLSMRGHGANFQMIPAFNHMDYGKSEIPINFNRPRCETGPGYPIKTHGAEAQNSRTSRFRISSSESSTSLLPLVDNFGAAGNEDDANLVPLCSSSPQIIDRNFLTLGIGGDIEVRPNSNFSTREISNKLEEVSSKSSNPIVGYYPKNPSSRIQLAGRDARIQTNAGGLLRPGSNFSARKIPSKLEEVSSQFNNYNIGQYLKNPLSLTQLSGGDARIQTNAGGGGLSTSNSNFSAQDIACRLEEHCPKNPSNLTQLACGAAMIQPNAGGLSRQVGNLASRNASHVEGVLIGDTGFRLNSVPFSGLQTLQANLPSNTASKCNTSVSEPTPLLLPSGSTLFSQPICSSQPEINSTNYASQPISWHQDYSRKSSIKALSESYRNHLSLRHQLSSVGHLQPGNLSLAAECTRKEVAKIGSFPSSVQPVGQFDVHNASPIGAPGNYISPERIGVQVSKSSTDQSAAAAGHFPKRLGLQPNDIAIAPSARGPSPIHLAAYSNQFRPVAHTTGQYLQHQHGMPVQSSSVFPGANSYGQVAPIPSIPPLKRKVENSSVLSGPPRKLLQQSVINDSTLQQMQSIPAIPAAIHIPPAPLHVKWKGFDVPPEPTGQRCLLCKRDLSFTAEGVMYQPTAPPPVAVLPCGHTFHDHCLHIITPADQLKSPPCIPCAVGET